MPIDECPICFEHMIENEEGDVINKNIIRTECGHLFCKSCLEQWQRNEPNSPPYNCPTCRQPINRADETFTLLIVDEETLYAIEQSDIRYESLHSILLCVVGTLGGGFLITLLLYTFTF
jgi:hypothetical protein